MGIPDAASQRKILGLWMALTGTRRLDPNDPGTPAILLEMYGLDVNDGGSLQAAFNYLKGEDLGSTTQQVAGLLQAAFTYPPNECPDSRMISAFVNGGTAVPEGLED